MKIVAEKDKACQSVCDRCHAAQARTAQDGKNMVGLANTNIGILTPARTAGTARASFFYRELGRSKMKKTSRALVFAVNNGVRGEALG